MRSVSLSDDGSVSGDTTYGGEYVETHVAPSRAFLELLALEAPNYLMGGISSCRCALCSFQGFPPPAPRTPTGEKIPLRSR